MRFIFTTALLALLSGFALAAPAPEGKLLIHIRVIDAADSFAALPISDRTEPRAGVPGC